LKVRILPIGCLVAGICLLAACQANPTAEPTRIPTVQASAIPIVTAAASTTPFQTISVEQYQAESLCDHPYFPIRVGTEWSLSTADVVIKLKVLNLASSNTESTAQLSLQYDFGERYDQAWRCSADGIYGYNITSYSDTSGLVQPVALLKHTGLYLPQASLLKTGYTWDELTVTYNQGYTITTDLHYAVASMNPVTVLGLQVPGIQIQVGGKMTAVDTTGQQSERDVNYVREFGLGVGLVKEDQLVLRKLSTVQ